MFEHKSSVSTAGGRWRYYVSGVWTWHCPTTSESTFHPSLNWCYIVFYLEQLQGACAGCPSVSVLLFLWLSSAQKSQQCYCSGNWNTQRWHRKHAYALYTRSEGSQPSSRRWDETLLDDNGLILVFHHRQHQLLLVFSPCSQSFSGVYVLCARMLELEHPSAAKKPNYSSGHYHPVKQNFRGVLRWVWSLRVDDNESEYGNADVDVGSS